MRQANAVRRLALAARRASRRAAAAAAAARSDDAAGGGSERRRRTERQGRATSSATGEGQLNIIAWAGYAEDGSNDPKVDWVTPFEQQTGCQVNVKIGNTSDEMVKLMKTGQYDGVSASGDARCG